MAYAVRYYRQLEADFDAKHGPDADTIDPATAADLQELWAAFGRTPWWYRTWVVAVAVVTDGTRYTWASLRPVLRGGL